MNVAALKVQPLAATDHDGPSIEPVRDQAALRETLGCFPTGVAIMTTVGAGGAPVGVTVSSFNSVSLDPPLILWSLSNNAGTRSAFQSHPSFAVNILSIEQHDLAKQFARPGEDRFVDLDWQPGHGGAPILTGSAAVLECDVYRTLPGGDHEIYLGQVMAVDTADRDPLVFAKGQLGGLALNNS